MQVLFMAGIFLLAFVLWRDHHRRRALCYLVAGLLAARYYASILNWAQGLGADSLSEAQKFALDEAWFYLGTMRQIIHPMRWADYGVLLAQALGSAAAVVLVCRALAWWLARRRRLRPQSPDAAPGSGVFTWGVSIVTVLCFLVSVGVQAGMLKLHYRANSDLYEQAGQHFTQDARTFSAAAIGPHDLRVVIYIGESTTAMDWSLYGYGRDTTPGLLALRNRDAGLLAFRDVVSTQVGTSPSLLEALSVEVDPRERYVPIFERRRLSLVDMLQRLSIPVGLRSSQGATGTFNMAGSIIFKGLTDAAYSADTSLLGNSATYVDGRVPDDVYFKDFMAQLDAQSSTGPSVLFLHSYAGHGQYLGNIPERARGPVDAVLDQALLPEVFGDGFDREDLLRSNAQGYDSVMRYVDANLTHVIDQLAVATTPTVLLYFSDHGESHWTNVGHDASRFQHEMMRVPFLMYFNPAARQARSSLFSTFQAASRTGRPSTLAQVPATVLQLLGYRLDQPTSLYRGIGLDAEATLPPLVVRRVKGDIEYVRSHGLQMDSFASVQDRTDPATTMWLNRQGRYGNADRPALCYDDANTWAKAARGSLVADCLSVNLALQDGHVRVAPDLPDGRGWLLTALARMVADHGLMLRLDGISWPASEVCRAVGDWRQSLSPPLARMVLTVTASPDQSRPQACADLASIGVALDLRVPDGLADDAVGFMAWRQAVESEGWEAGYAFRQPPAADLLDALGRARTVRWSLMDVAVDGLPWQAAGDTMGSRPWGLIVRTDWDPNSRH